MELVRRSARVDRPGPRGVASCVQPFGAGRPGQPGLSPADAEAQCRCHF